jgi:hypothetical protein
MKAFRTDDRELFDFLVSRGNNNWRVRCINGAYIAFFLDSQRLQNDVADYKRQRGRVSRSMVISTPEELEAALLEQS